MNYQLSQTFSALKHRNFRLWFGGQVISLIGTWMQATAQGFLLYELTGSPVMLGLAGFSSGIPIWLFSLFSGMVSDRFPRKKVIMITQASMMVLGFTLAVLAFTNLVQPWHIVVLAFLLGTANAFDAPARQSFVVDMVPREELTNAIALNSSVFNLGTIIGPSIAGVVYALLGPAWCFTINGITFIPVLVALFLMNVPHRIPEIERKSPFSNLLDGAKFAFGHKEIRILLINLAGVASFSFSLMTLMPAWSTTVLGGDVTTNGLLLSARGAGSLIAALMIANLGSRVVRGKIWTAGSFVMPFALFFFGIFKNLPVSLVMLVILGWSLMSVVNITNALMQTHVPDNLRGRVMSIYILVFQGSFPLGSLLVGWWADVFGAPVTVIICSVVIAFIVGLLNIIHPSIREFN